VKRFLLWASIFSGVTTSVAAQGPALSGRVVTYDAPPGVIASADYSVNVGGRPVFVYTARTLAYSPASFASFDFGGHAEVEIDSSRGLQSVKVLPSSYGIKPVIHGRKIQFTLTQPCNVTVEINDSPVQALHLFANPIETYHPQAHDPGVLYFGPGIHLISTLALHDGAVLYLAGGAVLRGILPPDEKPSVERDWAGQKNYHTCIHADHAKNIRICGRGILDLSNLPWHARTTLALRNCSNVTIEGITLIGSPAWTVALFGSTGIHIRNIKEICSMENSDGIDICNSQNVTVDGCFLRNNDDEICVKTTAPPPAQASENIVVQNCVVWNERARGLGITNETRQDIDHVVFRNCDIIHDFSTNNSCAALAVIVSDSGMIRDIHFEDIRVESVKNQLILCSIVKDMWGHDEQRGHINDLTFKNVVVNGDVFPTSQIAGYDNDHTIESVTFDHLQIQGRMIDSAGNGKISVNSFVHHMQFLSREPGASGLNPGE
jgi:hypothetical protein